jgi:chromosome segregation ATPase
MGLVRGAGGGLWLFGRGDEKEERTMNDESWEDLAEAERRQNARIAALEKSCQAILAAYQDVSGVLAQAQQRIMELENRLAIVEEHRAWTERDTELLNRVDDETRVTIREELGEFRSMYAETLNCWRLDVLAQVREEVRGYSQEVQRQQVPETMR